MNFIKDRVKPKTHQVEIMLEPVELKKDRRTVNFSTVKLLLRL